jgi:hypothetical protein
MQMVYKRVAPYPSEPSEHFSVSNVTRLLGKLPLPKSFCDGRPGQGAVEFQLHEGKTMKLKIIVILVVILGAFGLVPPHVRRI